MGKPRSYAKVVWCAGDVKSIRPRWTLKRCEEELAKVAKYVQEASVERGWAALEDLLPGENTQGREQMP